MKVGVECGDVGVGFCCEVPAECQCQVVPAVTAVHVPRSSSWSNLVDVTVNDELSSLLPLGLVPLYNCIA
jgi:hypothetical protein